MVTTSRRGRRNSAMRGSYSRLRTLHRPAQPHCTDPDLTWTDQRQMNWTDPDPTWTDQRQMDWTDPDLTWTDQRQMDWTDPDPTWTDRDPHRTDQLYSGRVSFYTRALRPALFALDAERAHE